MASLAQRDQENLGRTHLHTGAASTKPLSNATNALAPKTPGNLKTNNAYTQGRTAGRTGRRQHNENNDDVFGGDRTGKQGKASYVTPLPWRERERAPLGAKTTNGKVKNAQAQTPAPLFARGVETGLAKTGRRSVSTRKSKLKVHQQLDTAESEVSLPSRAKQSEEDEEDVPEIEYCPPKVVDLPNLPDPDPATDLTTEDYKFMRDTLSFTFGTPAARAAAYSQKWDALEESREQFEQEYESLRTEMRRLDPYQDVYDHVLDINPNDIEDLRKKVAHLKQLQKATVEAKKPRLGTKTTKPSTARFTREQGPNTLRSREAASALSRTAASDSMSRAPVRASVQPTSAVPAARVTQLQNSPGVLASRSTIGYAKGRKVAATVRAQAGRPAPRTGAVQSVAPRSGATQSGPQSAMQPTTRFVGPNAVRKAREEELINELLREYDDENEAELEQLFKFRGDEAPVLDFEDVTKDFVLELP